MATYTDKLNLKKPDETDFVDIADINENMDAVDSAIAENEQKISELKNRIDGTDDAVSENSQKITDLENNMNTANSAISANTQKITELENSMETLPPPAPPTFEIGEDGHLYAIYEEADNED